MTLEDMLKSAVERDGKAGSSSTIIAVDLRQKIEFAVRGGNIEFIPAQDDEQGSRKKTINKIFKDNRLSQRLEYAMSLYLTCGEICWLVLPDNKGGYLIEFYHGGATDPDPEYKVFYKAGGRQIESVVISYPYKIATPDTGGAETERWVKLRITEEFIEQSDLPFKPNLRSQSVNADMGSPQVSATKHPNPFAPTIPVVICPNNPKRTGQEGTSDYHWMRQAIESHDRMISQIQSNLHFFGNPTLVTTRSTTEILEAAKGLATPTWASQQGFVDGFGDAYSASTRVTDPMSRRGVSANNADRVARVIGGVAEGERFGYIQPDPVTGDLNQFQRQQRELIHYALGGLDPLGISSGATAFEIKTLFGRVQNTADSKADGLYTHGLALVFEQILYFEEQLFKDSVFLAMTQAEPERWVKLTSPSQITDDIALVIYQTYLNQEIKLAFEPQGLVPLGDRTINWRFTKPVFQNSTRELLDLSIAARNAREDGLSQEYCLRMQHPDMTDKEIQNVMSGFSPRVVEGASNSINVLLQLYQQFMMLPDPQDPNTPWGIRLGIPEMLEEAILTLEKELAYGKPQYDPAESSPTINDATSGVLLSGGDANTGDSSNAAPTSAAPTSAAPTSAASADLPVSPSYNPISMAAYGLPAAIYPTFPTGIPAGTGQGDRLSAGTGNKNAFTPPAPGATISRGSVFGTGNSANNPAIAPVVPGGIPAELAANPALWHLYAAQFANSGDGLDQPRPPARRKRGRPRKR